MLRRQKHVLSQSMTPFACTLYRYRFSLKIYFISTTDTDFGLETNKFCNGFGYSGMCFCGVIPYGAETNT